ncbi:LCP family protein [Saccharopolyspora rosea]|uniref:LCP family protein n=1 Tax=Saccharopolyspora rosea TaxID=524884 RepID=A0ABW3FMU8_9PSEU|nr:LCP family protein [Saccharopolyspora rosea]
MSIARPAAGTAAGAARVSRGIETTVALRRLVDAIGGIEVTLPEPVDDPYSGLHLGRHLLDGEQALAFNRTTHGVGDGSDVARIGLQHQFLTALQHKLDAEQLLSDPVQLQRILPPAGDDRCRRARDDGGAGLALAR